MSNRLVGDEEMQNRRKAGMDPTRLRMCELFEMRGEWTAKELAEELKVPANRLYYHLRLLEQVGAIKVTGTKAVGRLVERVYAPATDFFRVTWDAKDPAERSLHVGAILDSAKVEAEDALYEQARQIDAGEEPLFITYARPSISGMRPEDIAEFHQRLLALDKEFRDRRDTRKDSQGDLPADSVRLKYAYVLLQERSPKWLGKQEPAYADDAPE